MGSIWLYAFQYPYFNNIDIHYIPEWAKGAVVYQVFPDRFSRSDNRSNTPNAIPWDTLPDRELMIGGDLQGILQRLDHLAVLGIELLYLNPIFKAHSNHKYDTIDYKQIDPAFGTNEDFKMLVEKSHELGIRVILDAVFNHCGPEFAPFVDVREKGEASVYKDWFYILHYPIPHYQTLLDEMEAKAQEHRKELRQQEKQSERPSSPLLPTSPSETVPEEKMLQVSESEAWAMAMDEHAWTTLPYETFAYTPMMPKLNTENAELKEYLLEVGEYWVREFDIDGWRLDVANEVDHVFWREFHQRIRNIKEDILIVGEIWSDASPWLQGDQFDCVMNYPFQNLSFDFILHKRINASRARQEFNTLLLRYSPQVNLVQWNMLDSHDTARLIYQCEGDEKRTILLLGFMLTYVGMPLIYYGTEIGLDGAEDPDCRRCMPWAEDNWNMAIYRTVKKIILLRKQFPVLRKGSLRWIETDSEDILAYERFDPELGMPGGLRQPELKRKIFLNRSDTPIKYGKLTGNMELISNKISYGILFPKSIAIF